MVIDLKDSGNLLKILGCCLHSLIGADSDKIEIWKVTWTWWCLQFIEGDPHSESEECRKYGAVRSVMWMLTETQEQPIRSWGWGAPTNEEWGQGDMYYILSWGEWSVHMYRERRGTKGLYSTLYCTLNITVPSLRWQNVSSAFKSCNNARWKVPRTVFQKDKSQN